MRGNLISLVMNPARIKTAVTETVSVVVPARDPFQVASRTW